MKTVYRFLTLLLMLLGAASARAATNSFAVQFDGVGTVTTAGDAFRGTNGVLTVTAWMKTTMTNGLAGVIMKYDADRGLGWQVFLADGVLRAWYYGAPDWYLGGVEGLTAGRVADGAWHHIAFVVDEEGGRIQVDGDVRAAEGWVGAPSFAVNTGDLVLGIGVGVGLFKGTLDEVAVWERALSESEVVTNRNRSRTGHEADLRYYFRLSEGQGVLADNSTAGSSVLAAILGDGQKWVPGLVLAPAAFTLAADAVTSQSARLKGEVTGGGTNTTAWFEWGATTNYGHVTVARSSGVRDHAVEFVESIPGLVTDSPVHYRVVASNALGVAFGADAVVIPPSVNMTQERFDHTATLLPDGRVLVAGGYGVFVNNVGSPTNTAELFDPSTGRWTATGSMNSRHGLHSATLLLNGQVLVLDLSDAELYDPALGTWRRTGKPNAPHNSHTATLLEDGRVLVAGGFGNNPELYDPRTGRWTLTGTLNFPRSRHSATLLSDGRVLVAGGDDPARNALASAEIYDPATGQWTLTGSMRTARVLHTATRQLDGLVLVVAGSDNTNVLRTAERYNPETGEWTLVSGLLSARRYYHSALRLPRGAIVVIGGDVSGPATAELIEPFSDIWQPAPAPEKPRSGSTATLLPSGQILLAGGAGGDAVPLASMELYTPQLPGWSSTTSMSVNRNGHTATLLPNGRVLVAGFGPTELFSPTNYVWSNAPALKAPRASHTATLLPDGKVLVAGGYDSALNAIGAVELFDSTVGRWIEAGPLNHPRYGHTATLLRDGQVLLTGGVAEIFGSSLDSVERFDPTTGRWSEIAPLLMQRSGHTATLLLNGKVLIAGGGPDNFTVTDTAEIYDPATGQWAKTGPMTTNRSGHRAVLLPNGTVLVAGGVTGALLPATATAEIYDPATETWATTASMFVGRANTTATLLPGGRVLMAGGFGPGGYLDSGELYDPAFKTWLFVDGMETASQGHTATILPTGRLLVVGGLTSAGGTNRAELFHAELGAHPFSRTAITDCPSPVAPGDTLRLTGVRLRGVTGASSGSQKESTSDVPVVQLRALESGQTVNLSSTNWSTNTYTSQPLGDFPTGWAMVTPLVNGMPGVSALVEIRPASRPALVVERVSASSLRVQWPSTAAGFVLQEKSNFEVSNWVNVTQPLSDNGTNRSVTVNPTAGHRFYRLFKH